MDTPCPRDRYINSPGGVIDAGSEIYTMLRSYGNARNHIVGQACSAASIIAMSAWCDMSPTGLMMVHCVSTSGGRGNHTLFEHTAEMLRTADTALCTAYTEKSGMSQEEALAMMEHETWLTAERALELHLIDAVMYQEEKTDPQLMTAGDIYLPGNDQMDMIRKVMQSMSQSGGGPDPKKEDLEAIKAKMKLLSLRGELRNDIQ